MKNLMEILSKILTFDEKGPFGMIYTGKDQRRWLVVADYKVVSRMPLPTGALGEADGFIYVPGQSELAYVSEMVGAKLVAASLTKEGTYAPATHTLEKFPQLDKVVAQIALVLNSNKLAEIELVEGCDFEGTTPVELVAVPDGVMYRIFKDGIPAENWLSSLAKCKGTLPQGIGISTAVYAQNILLSPWVKSFCIHESTAGNRWLHAHGEDFDIWLQCPILNSDNVDAAMEYVNANKGDVAPAGDPMNTEAAPSEHEQAHQAPAPAKPKIQRTPPPVVTDLHKALLELDTKVRAHEAEGTAIRQLLGSIIKEAGKPAKAESREDTSKLKAELDAARKELAKLEKIKRALE